MQLRQSHILCQVTCCKHLGVLLVRLLSLHSSTACFISLRISQRQHSSNGIPKDMDSSGSYSPARYSSTDVGLCRVLIHGHIRRRQLPGQLGAEIRHRDWKHLCRSEQFRFANVNQYSERERDANRFKAVVDVWDRDDCRVSAC